MESANLLESSLYCCHKCKGLYTTSDDKLKHQISCMGNPMDSTCAYFACERKIFLQLFQPEDFLLDGCDPPLLFSKDDSFINHFVKIRIPDIFDPSIFLKTASALQPNQGDAEDTNFLIESNIDPLQEEAEKANVSTYADPSKKVDPITEDRIQSIINKNIEYLKHDDIPSLSDGRNKVDSSFSSSQSFPQLLSPIDKHLHLFGDGSKSRLQSPFERGSGLLHDGQLGYSSGNFMYSSNPSLPFSCGLSTDLFSSIPPPQEENQQTLPTNIEEFPTLQYLDLAKKDPFFGQNPGLSQINNSKDPFLINAAFKTTERQNYGLQKSQITRSCEDLQSSPTLPLQDGNYFNFPSTLDEPTQLDYLDLATLDFITNPNLINCAPINSKEKSYEKDQDIFSEDNITCHETSSIKSEAMTRLGNTSLSDQGRSDGLSAFSRVKKKKKLRLKKSKSDIERRYENILPQNRNSLPLYPAIKEVLGKHSDLIENMPDNIQQQNNESLSENTDVRKCRKRRSDSPKGTKSESKFMKMNRKSEKHLNVREKLTHLTEEQKDNMKAVLGQTGCIFVKKKRSLSCDEPVVYVNDSQVFGGTGLFRETSEERHNKFHPIKSNSKIIFDEQCKTRKLTSVLHLKCLDCDFQCRSVIELKNHRAKHIKKSEDLFDEQTTQPSQITVMPNMLSEHQKLMEKDRDQLNKQRMSYYVNTSCNLENIPEVAVVDEHANSGLFEVEVNNSFTTSLSMPFISESSEQNICEGSAVGEAVKDLDVSSRETLSSLPVGMPYVTMKPSENEKVSVPLLNKSSTSLFSNSDLNKETEMAVRAIESISSEYDKCNLDKEDISSGFSDYITVKTVLDQKIETNCAQGQDNDLIYDKSGLDVLNINSLEQHIQGNKQEENFETYSSLTNVPLFQDEQTHSNLHDTEISKAVDEVLTENRKQDAEVTDRVFEDLLDNVSCGTSTNSGVFLVKDDSAGVKMDLGIETSGNGDQARKTKNVENTMNDDLNDFNSTSNIYFENYQVLVETNVHNLQDLEEPRVENLQDLVEQSVEQSVENLQNFDETNVHEDLLDNTNKICDDIKDSDMFIEDDGKKERDIKENGNNVKHTDTKENSFPITSINSFKLTERTLVENVAFREHSNTFEKLSQNVSDPDVGTYLDKLVDFVSSENIEYTSKHLQDDVLKNVKPACELDADKICEFKAETAGINVTIFDKRIDVLELKNISKESIKESFEVLNEQTCDHMTESFPNCPVVTDSANISGHELTKNVLVADEFADDFCIENKTESTQFISVAANKNESAEAVTVNNSNNDYTDLPITVDSLNDCTNLPIKDHISINLPKRSDPYNGFTNEFENIDIKSDVISVPVTDKANNDSLHISIIGNTRDSDRESPEKEDIMSGHDSVTVINSAIDTEGSIDIDCCEPKDDIDDNKRNEPDVVDNQNTAEKCCQLSNMDCPTAGFLSSKNDKDESGSDALKRSTVHKACSAAVDQNKKEQFTPNPLSKVVQGKGYKKQVKECDGYFLCDVTGCQFKTQYKSNVAAHYQHVHLALKKYMCDQCVYSTPNKSCLKHHMQLNHLKEKKFKCPNCDYLSLFHSDIVKHVRHTHMKQKQYACNQCEYRTGHSHSLKLHIMSHNGIRPYKCSSCEYRANNANKVTRHIKLCHGNEVGVSCIKEDLTFEIDAKQFQCEEIISYQDIKVIELTSEEADVIMKQREVKKEQEKEAKILEKKAKEAEKKAKREMKRKEEEIANTTALNAIEKFSTVNNVSTKDIKVIKLTPETARAFMEAKVTEKSSLITTDKLGEIKKYTKILQKPKFIASQYDKGTSLIQHDVEHLTKKVT